MKYIQIINTLKSLHLKAKMNTLKLMWKTRGYPIERDWAPISIAIKKVRYRCRNIQTGTKLSTLVKIGELHSPAGAQVTCTKEPGLLAPQMGAVDCSQNRMCNS